ncbi:MAG TPA: bacillithiol system redox-active protein YtxJ [Balneolales bacterium]|nr:bacillithiol system redox-active protein YtxJ [Balneolales bacterium]
MRKNWVETTDTDAIERIIHRSNRQPQIIFKHSTRCGTSSSAYKELDRITDDIAPLQVEINYVDVIKNRNVSRMIAERLGVKHQSPQILLVQNNNVIWHASHYDITAEKIIEKSKEAVEALSL